MKIKKFVINLKRRPDRLEEFRSRFGDFSKDVNVFSAVDGHSYVNNGKLSSFESDLLRLGNFTRNRNAELGCWLSHYNLWKFALTMEEDYLVVFEDDAFPSDEFNEKFFDVINNFNPYLPILFFGGRSKPNFKPRNMKPWVKDGAFYFVKKTETRHGPDMDRTFHAYMINRFFAKFLIDKINRELASGKKIEAVDAWVGYARIELGALDYFPHIAYSPVNYKSDIR